MPYVPSSDSLCDRLVKGFMWSDALGHSLGFITHCTVSVCDYEVGHQFDCPNINLKFKSRTENLFCKH